MRSYYLGMKNQYVVEQSKYGLGVIWDGKISTISYNHSNSTTSIIDGSGEIIDISDINIYKYSSYFAKNRTSNRKPMLYRGPKGRIINPILLNFNKIVEIIKNAMINLIKILKLEKIVKSILLK